MAGTAKSIPRPEVAAFRRYYNDLLDQVLRPVKLAELLLEEGIITKDEKDKITSNGKDVEQTRVLLDAVQHILLQASEPSETIKSLWGAFGKAGFGAYIYRMEQFIAGEDTIALKLHNVIKIRKCVLASGSV